jgi:uncharacterized protein with gpF-like domain
MAFKASKERKRKAREPIAQGTQLIASAAISDAYGSDLKALIDRMVKDYHAELSAAMQAPSAEGVLTEDASVTGLMKRTLQRLDRKWRGIFAPYAKRAAEAFVAKTDKYSQFSAKHSLKSLGIDQPKDVKTQEIKNSLQSAIEQNVSLITNIQEKFATEIEGVVYRSIASSNPEELGADKIMDFLKDREGMTKRRAQFIAEDQTSKLYTALNKSRMEQNGVSKFKWKHSSASLHPRQTHIDRQYQDVGYGPGIFRLDSPELWEGPEQDQGLPGEAIHCRCRMIPIVDLD